MAKKYVAEIRRETYKTYDVSLRMPTDRPIALYYRQSGKGQVGNNSTEMQLSGLYDFLLRSKWQTDQIIVIDDDAGISAYRSAQSRESTIDKRPGMVKLLDLIRSGAIGAVAVTAVDRTFRDETYTEVSQFVWECQLNRVMVITPMAVFDFNHPVMGSFHQMMFIQQAKAGADYIKQQIIEKMANARREQRLKGEYTGGNISLGYLVCKIKHDPNYKRYAPFAPHANVVLDWFDLFTNKHTGHLLGFVRDVYEHGPYLPQVEIPEGYIFRSALKPKNGLLLPTRSGFTTLFTDAAYLGHWMAEGCIVRWNNHDSIVPESLFMRAFNYLSDMTLDGKPNPQYRPYHPNTRKATFTRAVDMPLLAGMIFFDHDGKERPVGTEFEHKPKRYNYVARGMDEIGVPFNYWRIRADSIDYAVEEALIDKLTTTFDSEEWSKTIASYSDNYRKERQNKVNKLAGMKAQMERIAENAKIAKSGLMAKLDNDYAALEAECAVTEREIAEMDENQDQLERLYSLRDNFSDALEDWDHMSREAKLRVIRSVIHKIGAVRLGKGRVSLVIAWLDNSHDVLTVVTGTDDYRYWTPEETERLLRQYKTGATAADVCRALPNRTFASILGKLRKFHNNVRLDNQEQPIRRNETFEQYAKRFKLATSVETP